MVKKFLMLEWRAFFRSASFATNLAMKILMGFLAFIFILYFLGAGIGLYYILKTELNVEPLQTVNQFMIYYLVTDLLFRMFMQKLPVVNLRPLLLMNIKRSTIVHYALGKTAISFFNILHFFFVIPFSIVLLLEGHDTAGVISWFVAVMALFFINNFINLLINDKDGLFIGFVGALAILGGLHYYDVFDITTYTGPIFQGFYEQPLTALAPVVGLVALYYFSFRYFLGHLHLDTGLSVKHSEAGNENLTWLDKYGTLGTFLKNDIRLIKRNKRSKQTVWVSLMFLFYGLLFFTNAIEAYQGEGWRIFAGIFVSGGFLFTFGQFVPSWDSSYYPLMMTQNISYREYIRSKWWLIVIATGLSTLLASFYIYFGWDVYLAIVVAAIYNIGFNSHVVLLGGAYIKTPIDLTSGKQAFGDKKAFNAKTLLLTLPKLVFPILVFYLGKWVGGSMMGYAFVAAAGILGFLLRDKVFNMIEALYKNEKYTTLQAYKKSN